jgi:threonine/homoserine/homoserine lactone efflux protein
MLGIFAMNVVTPGCSFVLTVSNAITHGRRTGFSTALGLVTADVLFAIAATVGLAAVVAHNTAFVKGISLVGGSWLVYRGLRMLLDNRKRHLLQQANGGAEKVRASGIGSGSGYRIGLLTGAMNVQAILFFSTMFVAALSTPASPVKALELVLGVMLVSAVARTLIVLLFTVHRVVRFYAANSAGLSRLSGCALALFGGKLAGATVLVELAPHLRFI